MNHDLEVVENLRQIVRNHQRRLIEAQDKSDPWWFLVDPDAPEGECSPTSS